MPMADKNEVIQSTPKRYLKKERLQELLEELFFGRSDFSITVCLNLTPERCKARSTDYTSCS